MAGYIKKLSLFFSLIFVSTTYSMELSQSEATIMKADSDIDCVGSNSPLGSFIHTKKAPLAIIHRRSDLHQLSRDGDTPRKRKLLDREQEKSAREQRNTKARLNEYPQDLVLEYFPEFKSIYAQELDRMSRYNEHLRFHNLSSALKASRPAYELVEQLYADSNKENIALNPVRKELHKTVARRMLADLEVEK